MTVTRTHIKVVYLVLLLFLLAPLPATHGQSAQPDAQRVELLDRMGGLVTASVPLPDGTVLMAEGPALVHLRITEQTSTVLARADLGHGTILDLVESDPLFYALTEEGLVVLAGGGEGGLPQPVGFAPGGGQTLAAQGNLVAIAAREAGLRLLRVDAQGVPRPLATLHLSGSALDVVLAPDGARAYVAGGEAGVHLVDLVDPANPRQLGNLPEIAPAEAVALTGAWLAVGSEGSVLVIDLPSGGEVVGVYAPLRDGRHMVIQGDFAYVADAAGGLKIFWLAAPDRPVQVYGEADAPVYDVLVEGDTAYVVGTDGLRVLDVGNRYRPLEIARLALPGQPRGIALAEGRAFVALGDQGVAVIDLTNLSAPRLEQRIPLEGTAHTALITRDHVYVAAGEAGLAVIDATQPGSASLITTLPLPGPALDLDRYGRTLTVAGGDAGLLAIDVTLPGAPALIGALPPRPGRSTRAVTLSGPRAYLAEGSGFAVVDAHRPDQIGRLAQATIPAQDIGIGEDHLYALSGNQIAIYDIRFTSDPVYLDTYTGLRQIARIAGNDDRLFLTNAGEGPGLVVLSLLTPDHPFELDSVGLPGRTYRAVPSSGEVWLASGYGGLRRYGLSEGGALIPRGAYSIVPDMAHLSLGEASLLVGGRAGWAMLDVQEHPQLLGQSESAFSIRSLAQNREAVAVAAGESGVALYSIADPGEPRLLARRDTHGPATGVEMDASFIYVADAGGLSIFDRLFLQPVTHVRTPAPANGIAVGGNLAYLALADGSLAVIDLAQPAGGIRISSSISTRRPTDLFLDTGGQLYGLADNSITLIRASDPARLGVISMGNLPHTAERGFFLGYLLATLSPGEALRLYDLPALDGAILYQMIELADGELTGEEVATDGRAVYIAYGLNGLGLINLTAPGRAIIFHNEEVHALYLDGDTLFALGSTLTAWDVSQREAPRLLDTLALPAPGRHIDPGTGKELLVSLYNGLALVEWDGAALSQTGYLTTTGEVDHAARVGTRAYLAMHDGGLLVADLTDPANPLTLFTYTSPSGQFVHDLLPLNETHLLVSWESGIDALDVSQVTTTPRLLNIVSTDGLEALDVALAPDERRAALALGDGGIAVLDLSDGRSPQVTGYAATYGDGLAAALENDTLYVADGVCGLRIFDLVDPTDPRETGTWRGSHAGDVAARTTPAGDRLVYLADANQLLTLRYDPDAPPAPPPAPQLPDPPDRQDGVPFDVTLSWGPPSDPCAPLTYDVYFGVVDDPPFLGQVTGEPQLEVGDLAPLRTYYWRVEVTDQHGDRARGPVWRFTTTRAEFADSIPPAPPPFVEKVQQNPTVQVGLVGFLVACVAVGIIYWYRRRWRSDQPAIPEWYTTGEIEDD